VQLVEVPGVPLPKTQEQVRMSPSPSVDVEVKVMGVVLDEVQFGFIVNDAFGGVFDTLPPEPPTLPPAPPVLPPAPPMLPPAPPMLPPAPPALVVLELVVLELVVLVVVLVELELEVLVVLVDVEEVGVVSSVSSPQPSSVAIRSHAPPTGNQSRLRILLSVIWTVVWTVGSGPSGVWTVGQRPALSDGCRAFTMRWLGQERVDGSSGSLVDQPKGDARSSAPLAAQASRAMRTTASTVFSRPSAEVSITCSARS
jgi:hypothetical protein